jgi:hypothetical protein
MNSFTLRKSLVSALSAAAILAGTVGATTAATQSAAGAVAGTVSGIVYRDWNYTGTTTDRFGSAAPANYLESRNWPSTTGDTWSWERPAARYTSNQEPGEAGIPITVTDNTGATWSATTGTNGQFSISVPTAATSQVRVEMSIPTSKSYLVPGPKGARSGGNVQFVTLGTTSTNLYFSVANPAEYCKHDSSAALRLVTPCWKFGDQKWSTPRSVLESLPFDTPTSAYSSAPGLVSEATENQIGTTYGLAWDPYRQNLFAAAYMRRHAGFGPGGPGGIYKITQPGSGTKSVSVYADLNALFGAGTAGTDTHPTGTAGCSGDRIFNGAVHAAPATTCENAWGHDIDSYDNVGKTSLGDIEISEDGQYLYVVNMQDRKVYRMSAATAPATSADVTRVDIPIAASGTGGANKCANSDSRPMAITIRNGAGYVGVVCSQESGSGASDGRGYVYRFDPVAMTFTAAPALNFKWTEPWGNYRDASSFTAWTNSWIAPSWAGDGLRERNNQAIIASIAFDDNDMLVGIRNRYHDQIGQSTFNKTLTDTTVRTNPSPADGGSIIRSCPNGVNWAGEGESGFSESNCTGGTTPWWQSSFAAARTTSGGQSLFSKTTQATQGAIVTLQGNQSRRSELYTDGSPHADLNGGKLIYTMKDANGSSYGSGIGSISPEYGWDLSNGATNATNGYAGTDGSNFAIYAGAPYSDSTPQPTTFGSSNGLGDLEVLCLYAPIDLGDRVWRDSNSDGLQGADEPGLANVTVRLMQGTSTLGTATTDSSGNYLFTSRTGTSTANTIFGVTNLKPGQSNIFAKVDITDTDIPVGFGATARASGTNVRIDSDGQADGSSTPITITTSYSQSLDVDFGFCSGAGCSAPTPVYAIGDTVFDDINDNALRDSGEAGVSGLTVELLNSSTLAVLATTVTNTSGKYVFDGLAAGSYKVRFSGLPSGGLWATQASGTDRAIDSNPDSTGVTGVITLDSSNTNLRTPVAADNAPLATLIDPTVDAGKRPPAPVVTSTVCLAPQ